MLALLVVSILPLISIQAQNATDALRYSMRTNTGSIEEVLMPGSGIGLPTVTAAAIYNPAALALNKQSTFQVSADYSIGNSDAHYLDKTTTDQFNKVGLGELGGVYSFDTAKGSFVVGVGYTRTDEYDNNTSYGGFNPDHTITDFFNQSGFYGDVAYNAFAIDSVGNGTKSVLRQEPGSFLGVQQDVSREESGSQALYSFTIATEFQKNLFIGATASIIGGQYDYARRFVERDPDGRYIRSGPTTDFQDMRSVDEINAVYSGYTVNVGLLFEPIEQLGIGVSYQVGTDLEVEESYSVAIRTRFDNGDTFSYMLEGNQVYKVAYPSRFSAGVVLKELANFEASFRAEMVDYSMTSLEDIGNYSYQEDENEYINNTYTDVWNLSAGLGYQLGKLHFSGGASLYPSPLKEGEPLTEKWIYSGGVVYDYDHKLSLHISGLYSMQEDKTLAYQYTDPNTMQLVKSEVEETMTNLKIMAGFKVTF